MFVKTKSSVEIQSCNNFKTDFKNECKEENSINYCINNNKNGNNRIFGLNEAGEACSTSFIDGTYVFSIQNGVSTLVTTQTVNEINEMSLAMYQCLTNDNIQSCKKTAGYLMIERAEREGYNYYSIPMNNGYSSKVIDTTLRNSCSDLIMGELFMTDDGEKALCLNDYKIIKFSNSEYYNKKYLILDTIKSGAFVSINNNSNKESGIVIISIFANNEFPAIITYDMFYSKINYCYDRNDGELLDRKRNLCKRGADCEYYYCENGICNPSQSSCPKLSQSQCNPTVSNLQSDCKDGYYIVSKDRKKIITDSNESGILYNCENRRCQSYSNQLGYFFNANINSDIQYIKCLKKYYTIEYQIYRNKRKINFDRHKRQKDSTDAEDNYNTNYNDENYTKPKYSYIRESNEIECEGINITNIGNICNEVGQLITKDNKIYICLSDEGDENVVTFTDENNVENRYKIVDGNLLTINVNSTDTSIPKAVIEVNEKFIQMAVGNFFVNKDGIFSSTEGDIGTLYKCYGHWCDDYRSISVGYYVNKIYNKNDSNSSPYIRCSPSKSGILCENIKVTKTKCGTNQGDAQEGELFITLTTEKTNNDDELLDNTDKNEYELSPYYDGNHYNICLDTSNEIPISLRLNYDITSTTNYMIRKNVNNIFGTGSNEYGVIAVLQYDVELSNMNNLFKYTDETYKVYQLEFGISDDNICFVGGSLIEFEGNCTYSENEEYIEECNGYKKNSILNIKLNDVKDNPNLGNLVFFGRGQEHLAHYWNDEIDGSLGLKTYFPKCEDCVEGSEKTSYTSNKPLVLYLPGSEEASSYIKFNTINENNSINLYIYDRIKSEIKLIPPTIEELKSNGFSCNSFDLPCTEFEEYDFNENNDWIDKTEIKFLLRSEEGFEIEINIDKNPSNEWHEHIGYINKNKMYEHVNFTEFVIKNYGIMPVFVLIGNTMFLMKDPIYLVKDGVIQNGFNNWSWHQNTSNKEATYFENKVYEDDPEQKNCVKFIAKEDGDYSYYVHIDGKYIGAPEAISFKIRPMNDNKFKLKIDNKKEFQLMEDYLIHRNCDIPIGEESNVLIDVRSLIYSDPTNLLNNDISGFWLQTISEIKKIKQKILKEEGQEAAEAYSEVLYFYDFVIHNTYPDDLGQYVEILLSANATNCNINMETHKDWEDNERINENYPVIPWPDDIDLEKINEF